MKKNKPSSQNELCEEYRRADFTGPLVRGKYDHPVARGIEHHCPETRCCGGIS